MNFNLIHEKLLKGYKQRSTLKKFWTRKFS